MKKAVMNNKLAYCFILICFFASGVSAKEVAGVKLEENLAVSEGGPSLSLNGAGVRYKFFFKIYVGALYLPAQQNDPAVILKGSQANRVLMHFLYDEVTQEKLVAAWQEGFAENVEADVFQTLKTRLDKFNGMFSDMHAGDVILLDYMPGKGTRVTIKGVEKGLIEGADFNQALLSVWLGEEPVTEELKDALLGIEED